MMAVRRKRPVGTTLVRTFPVSKYAAFLLISLNLHRLPANLTLIPGIQGPRQWLMLWSLLLMILGHRATLAVRRAGKDALSTLAFLVPGLLLLDLAAIAHVYFCWYLAGIPLAPVSWPVTICTSIGCVLWIYAEALPFIPYKSIWGIRTKATLASEDRWLNLHRRVARGLSILSLLCLTIGTMM